MPPYQHVKVPAGGQKITVNKDFSLNVSDHPIIPFIEGDGTGIDITPVMIKVVDAAVAKAYGAKRKIHWMEIYAGEKSTKIYGPDVQYSDRYFHSFQQTSDGGFIAAGSTNEFNGGDNSIWLVKTDSNGNISNCADVHNDSA